MSLIFLHDNDVDRIVERVPQGTADREHRLRDLIHDHPASMPVRQIDPGLGRVFTVAKEFSVPGVGFIDVLLADERGRLIVVECKLWSNPQARREVVGQILDYARELARYGYEDLQRQISVATRRSGNVLYELACDAGCDLDEASFVDAVSRDLAAGRFLLLVAGDGITEGTRRIGEYLRDQPGLAFGFGLVEIAEYRYVDDEGEERTIVEPRMLAQTAIIERHVIRSEVPGLVIETLADASGAGEGSRPLSDAGLAWRRFVERFAGDVTFDDPGQPLPRSGGLGWIKVPLPDGYYINLYRSQGEQMIGAQVRFPGVEGEEAFAALAADRDAIDREFSEAGLEPLEWHSGDDRRIVLTSSSPLPWDEVARRSSSGNGSRAPPTGSSTALRPRLQRLTALPS